MVFLRLTVKIFPRDQLSAGSIASWSRSLLGGKTHSDDSKRAPAASVPAKKPGIFLLPIEKPDEISLAALAGLIQEKWSHLHPDLEPLVIKKILDDAKEDTELYPELTVADVWVDYGKAQRDGHDQRGSVRVIQKAGTAAPERFPSVEQDWDAAVLSFKRKRDKQLRIETLNDRVSPIQETNEDQSSPIIPWHPSRSLSKSERASKSQSPSSNSPKNNHYHHIAINSVESDEESQTAASGIIIAGTPPRRAASEELGESPSNSPASVQPRTEPKFTSHCPALTRRAATTSVRTISQLPVTQSPTPSVSEHHSQDQPRETIGSTIPSSSSDDSQHNVAPTHNVEPPKSVMINGIQAAKQSAVPQVSSQPSQVFDLGDSSDESDSTSDGDSSEDEDNVLKKQTVMKNGTEVTSSEEADSKSSDFKDETNNRPHSLADAQMDKSIANKKSDDNMPDTDGDVLMEEDVTGSQPSTHAVVSRKRKKSTEEPVPVKEARVEQAHPSARQISKSTSPGADSDVVFMHSTSKSPDGDSLFGRQLKSKSPGSATSQPVSPKSPRRQRAPSFSSPSRRLHYQLEVEQQSPARKMKQGLGLDFSRRSSTNEPSHNPTQDLAPGMATQDSSGGFVAKSNAPTLADSPSLPDSTKSPAVEQGKTKPSALRGKDSPQVKRLSVSFADGNTPSSQDVPPRSTPRNPAVISSRRLPPRTAVSQASQATPPSSAFNAIHPSSSQSTPKEPTQSRITRGNDLLRPQEKLEEKKLSSLHRDANLQPKVANIIEQMLKFHKRLSKLTIHKREPVRDQLAELRLQLNSLGLKLNPETSNNQELSKIPNKPQEQETPKSQKKPENLEYSGTQTSKRSAVNNSVKRPSRPSLKALIDSQKKEQAEKAQQARKAAQTARKPLPNHRPTVFDVPDGSESENDSDNSGSHSDSGDIMPDGRSRKLQRPWSQRV